MNKFLYRQEGRYNLLGNEIYAQYVFQFREDAPKELKRSFLINIEKDGNFSGSALDVAYELQRVIDSYWLNTNQPLIEAVVKYLEKWEEKDDYDRLLEEHEKLQKRLAEVEKKLNGYDHEEMTNWKPYEPELAQSE